MTHDPIISDCLKQIAHITQKYRNDIDAIAPMRVRSLEAMARTISEQSEKIAACQCRQEPGFEINTRRNNGPLDAQFTLARFKRMGREDAEMFGGCL